jgi:hypothetical protein
MLVSCMLVSCMFVSCMLVSCMLESCMLVSCLLVSCMLVSCMLVSCMLVSCLLVSCMLLACMLVSCMIVSCMLVSCLYSGFHDSGAYILPMHTFSNSTDVCQTILVVRCLPFSGNFIMHIQNENKPNNVIYILEIREELDNRGNDLSLLPQK